LDQIIYLDPADDLLSIRDRVEMAEARRVLLVIPPYSNVLHRRVDMQVIQRRAAQFGIQLGLVTGDRVVRSLAREVGLPVFDSVTAGKRSKRWHTPREDADTAWAPRRSEEAWEAAAQRGPAQVRARRHQRLRLALAWLLILTVAVTFVISAALIIPSAHIVLIPHNQPVSVTLNVAVNPNIRVVDYARRHIPATQIYAEVEGSAQVATTGQKDIPSTRATGKVIFVNQLSQPIKIPKGTAVRTTAFGTPIRFVTTADVQVSGGFGARAEATIEAVDIGLAGNVGANLINEVEGVAALAVRVSNPEPTRGGGVRQVPSVTQSDKDRLRAALLHQLEQRAYAQMQAKLDEQEYILPESLKVAEVLDETYDRFVTEEAPSLGLQMRVYVTALKVGMQDANALVYSEMARLVPPGYELIPTGMAFQRKETLVPADQRGYLTLVMGGSGYAVAQLNQAAIRQAVSGLSVERAQDYLRQSLPLQADPIVQIWPSWFGRVPYLAFRTEVEIKPHG